MDHGTVTFCYKPRKQPWKTLTLPALAFIQRFLQHVLPTGFQKVRSVGFLHPRAKARFTARKDQLAPTAPASAVAPDAPLIPKTNPPSLTRPTPDAPTHRTPRGFDGLLPS